MNRTNQRYLYKNQINSISSNDNQTRLSYLRPKSAYFSSTTISLSPKHNDTITSTTTTTSTEQPNVTEHSKDTNNNSNTDDTTATNETLDDPIQTIVVDNVDDDDDNYSKTVIPMGDGVGSEGELIQTQNNVDDTIEIVIHVPDHITIPGTEKGDKKLAIVYTCGICTTRSMKQFTERAYNHGVVIIKCPTCQQQHLIADRIGYFSEAHDPDVPEHGFDLSTVAKQYGQSYKRITATNETGEANEPSTTELTLEDWIGTDKMKELMQTVQKHKQEQSEGQNSDMNKKNDKDSR